MRPKIKICGIQSEEIAFAAAQAGADYIGIVCAPHSKRCVMQEALPGLVDAIHQGGAQAVLVVQDLNAAHINALLDTASFDLIQLHGQCNFELPKTLPRIYATHARTIENDYPAIDMARDFLIIDYHKPGSGKTFCWANFAPPQATQWFLAGGLTVHNVNEGIKKFAPFAVDVSSGVEDSSGKKNLEKIIEFINRVKNDEHNKH